MKIPLRDEYNTKASALASLKMDVDQLPAEKEEDDTAPRPLTLLDRLNKRGGRRKPPPLRTTIPIASIKPPGYGPYWVFMLVNVEGEGDSKKQTEVRLDTRPELARDMKNVMDQGTWAIVMKTGPFDDLDEAGRVLAKWSDNTRGQGPRLAQGICLWWERYRHQGIDLWVIDQHKPELQKVVQQRRMQRRRSIEMISTMGDDDYRTVREILFPEGEKKKRPKVGGSKRKV
jgi:hypothetical protein